MKCRFCGSSNTVKDQSRADTVCADCGKVLEESEVVCDVAFENTKVVGTFISEHMTGFTFTKNKHGTPIIDSSQIRLSRAYKEIQKIASALFDMAKKYFNLASAKKFIQGRKTRNVVGVILYTVCRIEKTKHLLMDFSDILQTNLYVLGSIYLKFIRLLQIKVPIIDPSLYIHRFCGKLEFGDNNKHVCNTALKILQCMSRDWMVTGRRPSGLCGAAILIAARIHGYKRTVKQVVNVVNVCDEVIRRRLEEFSISPICGMTLNEFETCEVQDDGKGNDPPAFLVNRKKEKELEKKLKEMEILKQKAIEIEKIFEDGEKTVENLDKNETMSMTMNITVGNNYITNDSHNTINNNRNNIFKEETYEENLKIIDKVTVTEYEKGEKLLQKTTNNEMIILSPFRDKKCPIESVHRSKDEDEYLSDLEEKDAAFYILSSEEYKLKKVLWEVLFKDWIEDQKDKIANENKKTTKKRPRNLSKSEILTISTPAEAIMKSSKFSKKLNISVLNKLFTKDK